MCIVSRRPNFSNLLTQTQLKHAVGSYCGSRALLPERAATTVDWLIEVVHVMNICFLSFTPFA